MKRFVWFALAAAALGFGAAGCKKAHNAGNDSMSVGGGRIVATGAPAGGVRSLHAIR